MRKYTGMGYMRILSKRARLKRTGRLKAYHRLGRVAVRYRKRMIAGSRSKASRERVRNPAHASAKMSVGSCKMDANSRHTYSKIKKTAAGQKTVRLFKKFWKIKCPPSVKLLPGSGPVVPLMGMGTTDAVYLSSGDKGQRGKTRRVVKGSWTVASDSTGKHVLLLTKRPIQGPLKPVGYAPETHYIPPADVESAGTHKKGFHWRHIHGIDDEKKGIPKDKLHWPRVFADRGGKVDEHSNFVYGSTPTAKISDWMYG